jgi:centromere/kinetochore protein ZW10
MTSIASILDLFRALVPVVQAEMMALSPALRIRFANDCTYLAADVSELASTVRDHEALSAKLVDASERLGIVGEQWFDDCLVRIGSPRALRIDLTQTPVLNRKDKRRKF